MIELDALVCDLDGVVYRLDEPIEGAAEAVNVLKERGVKVLFCTNNSTSTSERFAAKLQGMGVHVEPDGVITSSLVTAETLRARGWAGKGAYVVGAAGIIDALAAVGIGEVDAEACDVVVIGLDMTFDYAKLDAASAAVRRGAALIATNDDAALPSPDGARPGAGAILAAVERASGATAEVMGKPHSPMMDAVARRLQGCERIAMVGDRPETDLAGAAGRGWTTILVTSGVTPPDAAGRVRPKPDLVLPSLGALVGPDQA